MYPVSEAFLQAVQGNTRKYYWTGKITTAGGEEYPFDQEDIVKGSGYITAQCCGNSEIELGAVYAAEMGISLFLDIDRYTLEDAEVELSYHLRLASGAYETVPMGIFEVSEANRTVHVLELKAYDRMLRFDRTFNGFETIGTAYGMMALCSTACGVELAQTQAEIEALPNGSELLSHLSGEWTLRHTGMCCILRLRCWAGSSASTGPGSWNSASMGRRRWWRSCRSTGFPAASLIL